MHASIHPFMVRWWMLVYSGRKEPPLLSLSFSFSLSRCNASTEGKWEEQPIFAAPSLTRANNSVSQVSAPHYRSSITSQLSVPVSRYSVVLITKPRVLEFWCLDVGVCFVECVFFSGIIHAIDF
jgi:hypothetical protein